MLKLDKMMKLKTLNRRSKILLVSCSALAIIGAGALYFTPKSHDKSGIHLSQFPEGTSVEYQIYADAQPVETGKLYMGKDGVNLPLPMSEGEAGSEKEATEYSYHLSLTDPQGSKTANMTRKDPVDLLLNLNTETGLVDLKASGLEEYSDISLRKGGELDQITSDWAGLYSEQGINARNDKNGAFIHDTIELAFNNSMSAMDFDPMNNGRVEVFFGDSSAAGRSDVRDRYTAALQNLTNGLSAIMVLQTQIIGTFFDAKQQMVTQRKWQELAAQAHKDYHPSDQMCRFGTFMRSVASTEAKSEVNKLAMNRMLMDRYLAIENSLSSLGTSIDQGARSDLFVDHHCDPLALNESARAVCDILGSNGEVKYSVSSSELTPERLEHLNKDIDYQRTLLSPLTLDVDFDDNTLKQLSSSGGAEAGANELTPDERDVVALAYNLYFPSVFKEMSYEDLEDDVTPHYDSRSFASKLNVAHSSFINILGMKSSAPLGVKTPEKISSETPQYPRTNLVWDDANGNGEVDSGEYVTGVTSLDEDAGWAYMKAMMREFGISDSYDTDLSTSGDQLELDASGVALNDIDRILGKRPSYYAQMEVLTKKIYQAPEFYTNLYDKPENVKRIGVSMDAIELMNQRDRFESMLRQEMMTSVLLEEEIQKRAVTVNSRLYELMQLPQNEF